MDIGEFELLIGSPFDREKFICEISYKGETVAEISHETGEFIIEIFASRKEKWWTFPLDKFQAILQRAKRNLEQD